MAHATAMRGSARLNINQTEIEPAGRRKPSMADLASFPRVPLGTLSGAHDSVYHNHNQLAAYSN